MIVVSLLPLAASAQVGGCGGDCSPYPDSHPVDSRQFGSWSVSLIGSGDTGHYGIESMKVDRDLVAWTEVDRNPESGEIENRLLVVFDGLGTRILASLDAEDWDRDAGNGFFDHVSGNYDVADGAVVWIQTDGFDREVWIHRDGHTSRVSDNSYDDRHPVTSLGRVAWTSLPGGAYNLMVSDRRGVRKLDSYHVMNYAFSGRNLFWLNRLPHEDWFRVFREDGTRQDAVGEGDDRPLPDYFLSDGQGTVAWEYSTKKWDYDKRVVYLSPDGGQAVRVIQRDVPPNITRVEDVRGSEVLLNVHDLLTSMLFDVSLIRADGGVTDEYLTRQMAMSRARFTDSGVVRHLVPETSSALLYRDDASGYEDYLTLDHVIHDRFEAQDGTVIGALLKGGVILHRDGAATEVASDRSASAVATSGDAAAWIETDGDSWYLYAAQPLVTVRTSQGVRQVSGRLVKSPEHPAVYLAARDGRRYTFPSEGQFYSWYEDFSPLSVIGATELAARPLGGNVLYRPGSRLLKTALSPAVYIVGENGILHWVTDAQVLEDVYGQGWQRHIAVIPDSHLADYTFGESIGDIYGYHMALVE